MLLDISKLSSVNVFNVGNCLFNLILFYLFFQMLIMDFLCYSILFSYILLFLKF